MGMTSFVGQKMSTSESAREAESTITIDYTFLLKLGHRIDLQRLQ